MPDAEQGGVQPLATSANLAGIAREALLASIGQARLSGLAREALLQGALANTGSLATTEGLDSAAFAGTVTWPALTGTLAATEAPDSAAFTGAVTAAVLNFPNSPAINDTYTGAGITWTWDGVKWTVADESGGSVTSITAGTGLTGGTITTSGTIGLSIPVSIADGGTAATTAAAALTNLGGLPLTGGSLAGPGNLAVGGTLNVTNNATFAAAANVTGNLTAAGVISPGGISIQNTSLSVVPSYTNGLQVSSSGMSFVFRPSLDPVFTFNGSAALCLIWNNGNMNLAGTLTQGSDAALKQDFAAIDNGIDVCRRLVPKSFAWKHTPDKRCWGFIAQDVAEYLPEAVNDNREDGGMLGIDAMAILAAIADAVKHLDERLQRLEAAAR